MMSAPLPDWMAAVIRACRSFAGGVIYDRLGSYVWLFLASFAIGAMAVVLAFTFRPPALARPAPVAAALVG